MPHSQSYPVTPPQPHLSYAAPPARRLPSSGWCAFVASGVLALVFLVCVYMLGGERLFPAARQPWAGLVPIRKQGFLRLHPFPVRDDIGVESRYFSRLPPTNVSQAVAALDALFQAYPAQHDAGRHRNCWLEHPSFGRPCFFDVSWLAEVCAPNHSYGYEERDGRYSPCFVLILEQTGDWRPRITEHTPKDISDQYDPGFSPVHCDAKGDLGQEPLSNLTLYPPKGFSHLFFPASKFDPEKYLKPMVAVKLQGIPKGSNLTVECSVVTPNAFFLWNNGRVVLRFEAA